MISCKNLSNISACKPYFIFDHVEHYYNDISEDALLEMLNRDHQSNQEERTLKMLTHDELQEIKDTSLLNDIEELGFVRQNISALKIQKLIEIFCERNQQDGLFTSCLPVYRDIIVFKEKGKTIGVAKICFSCNQSVIIGSSRNTYSFGQNGEYTLLYELLHQ